MTYSRCHNQAVVELQLNAQSSHFLANAPFINPVASLIIIPLIYLVLQCDDNHGFFHLLFNWKSHDRVFPYEDPNAQRSMWLTKRLCNSEIFWDWVYCQCPYRTALTQSHKFCVHHSKSVDTLVVETVVLRSVLEKWGKTFHPGP